ncbi:unnamed protein product [Notodromas monacha]|uniref:DNA-directed RNA polymerase subunit beta n=1 Tax=Notodromas monacha TaxID=399045 RepID=A0A7R9BBY7_9CRUS|nr:unnamed protein product [Notodromas monacha]CAG0912450.1 unnamed protein product [Notodromas monacha]
MVRIPLNAARSIQGWGAKGVRPRIVVKALWSAHSESLSKPTGRSGARSNRVTVIRSSVNRGDMGISRLHVEERMQEEEEEEEKGKKLAMQMPLPNQKYLNSRRFRTPPNVTREFIDRLGRPHIQSFDDMIRIGLREAVLSTPPVEFKVPPNGPTIGLHLDAASLGYPEVANGNVGVGTGAVAKKKVLPAECRISGKTYTAPLHVSLRVVIDGEEAASLTQACGNVPVMVRSSRCHLAGLSPAQLVRVGEEENEIGGYFIVNGHEKLIRMLVATRRNYPLALRRPTWASRGKDFSDMGVLVRSVTEDQSSYNNVLHFLKDGSAKMMFAFRREMFFIKVGVILRALTSRSDQAIHDALVRGKPKSGSLPFSRRMLVMLRELHGSQDDGVHTQLDALKMLGNRLRPRVQQHLSPDLDDVSLARALLQRSLLPHLRTPELKFRMVVLMMQKLYALASNESSVEDTDSVYSWEVFLGGDIYVQVLKETMHRMLRVIRTTVLTKAERGGGPVDKAAVLAAVKTRPRVGDMMELFLATGNAPAGGDMLVLPQMTGLSVVAESISWARYTSHFEALHRGSFFVSVRSTDVRKLTPDAWGFVCPVHTPDGTPCGLLNHLAKDCVVVCDRAPDFVHQLRAHKERTSSGGQKTSSNAAGLVISKFTEIGFIPDVDRDSSNREMAGYVGGQFPGVFIFTGMNRLMRKVVNLSTMSEELVGALEQMYLHIACSPQEVVPGMTTHVEVSATSLMSSLACLIPLPDCNQSPRNMYQCQMAKQTMGTPFHDIRRRPSCKLYRLDTPNSPLFRTRAYDQWQMDDYPAGTNAIVAVIAYSSYDMEDAMIINKASMERGLAHGSLFKSELVDLYVLAGMTRYQGRGDCVGLRFARCPDLGPEDPVTRALDVDGLPRVGLRLDKNTPYFSYYSPIGDKYVVKLFRKAEEAVVNRVWILSGGGGGAECAVTRVRISVSIRRRPVVGDKFATRSGQKGICSMLWPTEDIPFAESGMMPDILFNPHGLPSRMTMAQMIEVMAGKAAALHGTALDATPFEFDEDRPAHEYMGNLLAKAGFNRMGTEVMMCPVTGKPFESVIFMGVVHYQRLRHMVLDKWQVRSTGPMNLMMRQPIKGRKRGGGVRVGEMERDAVLSAGCMSLMMDRLLDNSDGYREFVCLTCGTLVVFKKGVGLSSSSSFDGDI